VLGDLPKTAFLSVQALHDPDRPLLCGDGLEGLLPVETYRSVLALTEKPYLDGGVTNWDHYHDLRIRVLAGDQGLSKQSIIRSVPDKLAAKEAEGLLAIYETRMKEDDISKDTFYKQGQNQIQIILAGGTGLSEFLGMPILKPGDRVKYSDTLLAYDRYARQLQQQGKSLDVLPAYAAKIAKAALGGTIGGPTADAKTMDRAPKPEPAPYVNSRSKYFDTLLRSGRCSRLCELS